MLYNILRGQNVKTKFGDTLKGLFFPTVARRMEMVSRRRLKTRLNLINLENRPTDSGMFSNRQEENETKVIETSIVRLMCGVIRWDTIRN